MSDGWIRLNFSRSKLDFLREQLTAKATRLHEVLYTKVQALTFMLQTKVIGKLSNGRSACKDWRAARQRQRKHHQRTEVKSPEMFRVRAALPGMVACTSLACRTRGKLWRLKAEPCAFKWASKQMLGPPLRGP